MMAERVPIVNLGEEHANSSSKRPEQVSLYGWVLYA